MRLNILIAALLFIAIQLLFAYLIKCSFLDFMNVDAMRIAFTCWCGAYFISQNNYRGVLKWDCLYLALYLTVFGISNFYVIFNSEILLSIYNAVRWLGYVSLLAVPILTIYFLNKE